MEDKRPLNLSLEEANTLNEAALFLANPGMIAKGLALVGKPVELAHRSLPGFAQGLIAKASEKAIRRALKVALSSISKTPLLPAPEPDLKQAAKSDLKHRSIASAAGAVTGLFGLPLLPIELPFTTVVILRGILEQARFAGHDLSDPEIRLEALMVFSMTPGAAQQNEDGVLSYFATRAAFSRLAQKALSYSAAMSARELIASIDKGTAPALVRLITSVAEKFQIQVSQKVMAKSIPLAGAVGGGTINYAFTQFFITAAKYHFFIRALEKKYGTEAVQESLKEKLLILGQKK